MKTKSLSLILAGSIAAVLAPQLSASTVTQKVGVPVNSKSYVAGKGVNTLYINAQDGQSFSMNGSISGSGAMKMVGPGTVTFTGNLTQNFIGQTIVQTGTLVLNLNPGVFNGFNNPGGLTPDVLINGGNLVLGADNQLGGGIYVQMTSGSFDLAGHSATIYNFVKTGGTFDTGKGGVLTMVDPTWTAGSGRDSSNIGGNDISNTYQVGVGTAPGQLIITGTYATDPTQLDGLGAEVLKVVNFLHGDEGVNNSAAKVIVGAGTGGPNDYLSITGTGIVMGIGADYVHSGTLVLNSDVISTTATNGTASIISGPVLQADGFTVDSNPLNSPVIQGKIDLTGTSGVTQRNFTVSNSGATLAISAVLTNGGLNKAGAGTLLLSGANTYAGATTVSEGTLRISGAGSLGSGSYAGAVANSGTFQYSSSANQTLSGVISGTGALVKDTSSTSTLTISGANTYSGPTTVSAGTLATTGSAKSTSAVTVNTGGTLLLNSATNASNIVGNGTLTPTVGTTSTTGSASTTSFTSNGGKLAVAGGQTGTTHSFGAMTLSSTTNVLDFGSGNTDVSLIFGSLDGATRNALNAGTTTLNIDNWTGGAGGTFGDGHNRLIFTSDPGFGLGNTIAGINFTGFGQGTQVSFGSYFEIVAVPEPATLFGAAGVLGFVGYRERRRVRNLWHGRIVPGLAFLGLLLVHGMTVIGEKIGLLRGSK